MIRRARRKILLAIASLALPTTLAAQQPARSAPVSARRPAPAKRPPAAEALLSELQVINAKLEALQARALQDPQLRAAQQSLGVAIKTAMTRIDPELEQSVARGHQLQQQALAARQKGDQATLQKLSAEMQEVQQRFFTVQQEVVAEPALAAQLKSFQDGVQKKMADLDASAPQMIIRFGQLQSQLAATMKGSGN